jgi:formate dehydrogenase beta subunit
LFIVHFCPEDLVRSETENGIMNGSRRDFLKTLSAASVAIGAGSALAREKGQDRDASTDFSVLVDTVICIGCRKCEWACNQENKLNGRSAANFEDKSVLKQHRRPRHDAYTVINEFRTAENGAAAYTLKVQCMHCVDPACVSACIVGALRKSRRGPVVYDSWKCIGCRYCIIACPFQIPTYEYHDPLEPQVRKCTLCYERIMDEAREPACVAICPNEALTFGNRRDMLDAAHTRINSNPERYHNHVYGEHEVGGTSWLYLAPVDFKYTELPALGSQPIPHLTETIQHGIFKNFVPPLALYGLLGLIFHSLRNRGEQTENNE